MQIRLLSSAVKDNTAAAAPDGIFVPVVQETFYPPTRHKNLFFAKRFVFLTSARFGKWHTHSRFVFHPLPPSLPVNWLLVGPIGAIFQFGKNSNIGKTYLQKHTHTRKQDKIGGTGRVLGKRSAWKTIFKFVPMILDHKTEARSEMWFFSIWNGRWVQQWTKTEKYKVALKFSKSFNVSYRRNLLFMSEIWIDLECLQCIYLFFCSVVKDCKLNLFWFFLNIQSLTNRQCQSAEITVLHFPCVISPSSSPLEHNFPRLATPTPPCHACPTQLEKIYFTWIWTKLSLFARDGRSNQPGAENSFRKNTFHTCESLPFDWTTRNWSKYISSSILYELAPISLRLENSKGEQNSRFHCGKGSVYDYLYSISIRQIFNLANCDKTCHHGGCKGTVVPF